MGLNAFVTGGTGFIGVNLVQILTEHKWNVTALHRPSSDLSYIKRFPVTLKQGGITDYQSILQAIPDNTDVIFHLAGDTNLWSRNNDRQQQVNVRGAQNMMTAAKEKNVGTFVHTSSTSVWGSMSGKEISESVVQKGGDSWVNYERTKWQGEQEILKIAGDEVKTVILNPSTVTGPYDMNNWGRLFFALRDGVLPGIPDGVVSVTHVQEVARAHLSAVENGRHGESYILAGEDCRFSEFVHEIARISHIERLPRNVPTPILKLIARISLVTAAMRGNEPDITPELVKLMTRTNLSYSSRKAIDELGYRIVPMKKSVQDCYRWLCDEGYL